MVYKIVMWDVTALRGQQPMNAMRSWSLGLHTWLFLAYCYGLTFFIGYLVAVPPQRTGMILLCQCLLYASGATWVINDARRRKRPFTAAIGFWLYITAFISTPIYILCSRGWKGLAYLGLFLVGWYFISVAGWSLGNYVVSRGEE